MKWRWWKKEPSRESIRIPYGPINVPIVIDLEPGPLELTIESAVPCNVSGPAHVLACGSCGARFMVWLGDPITKLHASCPVCKATETTGRMLVDFRERVKREGTWNGKRTY